MSENAPETMPLTSEEIDRFHANAPGLLKQIGGGPMLATISDGMQLIVFGVLIVVGISVWKWPPDELLLFMVVGIWTGIFCSVAKLLLLSKEIDESKRQQQEFLHAWHVFEAIRSEAIEFQKPNSNSESFSNGVGIAIDFLVGGLATAILFFWIGGIQIDSEHSGLILTLLGVNVSVQIVSTGYEIFSIRKLRNDTHSLSPATLSFVPPGMRGMCLLLLVMLSFFLAGGEASLLSLDKLIIFVNVLSALLGIAVLLIPVLLRSRIVWLRKYLQERDEGPLRFLSSHCIPVVTRMCWQLMPPIWGRIVNLCRLGNRCRRGLVYSSVLGRFNCSN